MPADSCLARAKWSVLDRDWRTENSHEAIARKVLEDSSVAPDDFGLFASQALDKREHTFLAQSLCQRCESDQISEHHSDVATFAIIQRNRGIAGIGRLNLNHANLLRAATAGAQLTSFAPPSPEYKRLLMWVT